MLVPFCVTEFEEGCSVAGYFSRGSNVIEGCKGGVDEESLSDGGVEHLEPHVMGSVGGGYGVGVRLGMEGVAVDSLAGVCASLQRGDTVNLDVSDIGADLTSAKVICVLDGVVAGVSGVILYPVFKGWVVGAILLIAVIK
jgi:hypothetical protein